MFILAVWEEGEDPTEPTGILKSGMQPPQESKALIDGPKISDFAFSPFETRKRKRLIPMILGIYLISSITKCCYAQNERIFYVPSSLAPSKCYQCCKTSFVTMPTIAKSTISTVCNRQASMRPPVIHLRQCRKSLAW